MADIEYMGMIFLVVWFSRSDGRPNFGSRAVMTINSTALDSTLDLLILTPTKHLRGLDQIHTPHTVFAVSPPHISLTFAVSPSRAPRASRAWPRARPLTDLLVSAGGPLPPAAGAQFDRPQEPGSRLGAQLVRLRMRRWVQHQ